MRSTHVVAATGGPFRTEAPQHQWLTDVLAVMEGEFDEMAGRAVWNVFIPNLMPT